MGRLLVAICLAVMALVQAATPAEAHKLRIFATLAAGMIEGRVFFVGGGPAIGTTVTLRDDTGSALATTRTTAPDGFYAMEVPRDGVFALHADTGDGHAASFTLAVGQASPPAATAPAGQVAAQDATAQQIAALAMQIDALQESLRLRDLMGGVGYVLGLFGLWSLFVKRREGPK